MTALLPPNAHATLRHVDAVLARIGDISVPVGDLWNPDTCPAAALPWLAWALSVDTWDEAWGEARKRAVIDASLGIHQKKGTAAAVQAAVAALGPTVAIQEWYEYGGKPGTFRAVVEPDADGISAADMKAIRAAIMATKNARSWLEDIIVQPAKPTTTSPSVRVGMSTSYGAAMDITTNEAQAVTFFMKDRRGYHSSYGGLQKLVSSELTGSMEGKRYVPHRQRSKLAEKIHVASVVDTGGLSSSSLMQSQFLGTPKLYLVFSGYRTDWQRWGCLMCMVIMPYRRGDGAIIRTPADVFQPTGVLCDVRVYDKNAVQVAHNTAETRWTFSSKIFSGGNSNWQTRTRLTDDDGFWGVHLNGNIDGAIETDLSQKGIYGAGVMNTTDDKASGLHRDGSIIENGWGLTVLMEGI